MWLGYRVHNGYSPRPGTLVGVSVAGDALSVVGTLNLAGMVTGLMALPPCAMGGKSYIVTVERDGYNGIHVYDTSNPAAVAQTGAVASHSGGVPEGGAHLRGGIVAFNTLTDGRFRVAEVAADGSATLHSDVSTKASISPAPSNMVSHSMGRLTDSLLVVGLCNFQYTSSSPTRGAFTVFDVTDPAAVHRLGPVTPLEGVSCARKLEAFEGRFLAASGSSGADGTWVFDMIVPAAPRLLTKVAHETGMWGLGRLDASAVMMASSPGGSSLKVADLLEDCDGLAPPPAVPPVCP